MYKGWLDADGTVASADEISSRNGSEYSVVFTYKVNDEWYGGTYTTYEAYSKGDSISLLYDPANPERNNLVEKEKIRHWIIAAVFASFGLVILYLVFAL